MIDNFGWQTALLVFAALMREIKVTFGEVDKSVVVMKIIGPLTDSGLIK